MKSSLIILYLLASVAWSKPITLAWDKNPEPDIVAYHINYGSDPALLEKRASVGGERNEVTLDLPLGEYWFTVQATAITAGFPAMTSIPSRRILGVVREPENLGWLARGDWKLTSSSEESPAYELSLATDDDLSSFWHIRFQPENAPAPHWVGVELPELANVFALYVLPRSDGFKVSNITAYEVQSSVDGKVWEPWAKGVWTDSADLKKAELSVRNTRFVRLVLNGVQASIADLNLLGYYGPPEAAIPAPAPKPPQAPGKLRVVKIETSANLTEWEPIAFVPLDDGSAVRFIRAGITEIETP